VTTTVTVPGVYDGMPPETYHADPVPDGSLSSGGARKLLPPSCPAKFRHWQLNGQDPADHFDLGHAAHKLVLGIGPELVEVVADDWRTKAAKEAKAAAHEAGQVPLLDKDMETVHEMATVLREHPIAGRLFQSGTGRAEQSAFWWDETFGVWRRARFDWLPDNTSGGRVIIPDYKTCNSADPVALGKSLATLGYDQQAEWYSEAARALGIAADPVFLMVFQEKTAPYVITICQPDVVALRRGRDRNRLALALYADCKANNRWPAYADKVINLTLPVWVENEYETEKEQGAYDVGGEAGWRTTNQAR
jgi:hypothetical protein